MLEEKLEDRIQLHPVVEMDDRKKVGNSTSLSNRRKVCIYVLFASMLAVLIGINITFILCSISKNANDQNVDLWRSLIISDGKNLYAFKMDSMEGLSLLQTSKSGIAAFDVYSNETVLWNELPSSTIQSTSKLYKSVEDTEIWRMQAIAIDQVNKLFYIIDKSAGTLSVFDVHAGIHGIVYSDLVRAHDLALDPASGLMFILQQYDSILRCDMDGTSRREVVTDPSVSAFAIDRETRFIYYAKNSLGIKVVDYEGRREIKIMKIFVEVLSLALVQNQLFWTTLPNSSDTGNSELWSCNIHQIFCYNATRREISLKNPRVIKAASILQPFDNPCGNNADCEQLCLLASNNSYSCACNKGWYLNPSSGTCQEVISALTYVQGNYIRAKHPSNVLDAFSDIIIPRSFYTETLIRKGSIDYTYGIDNFYISDDTAIYSLNKTSQTINGNQKKIFTAGKGSYIRNIDFDILNEYMYYVDESSIGDRSIAVLSLVMGELTRKTKVKCQVGVFLIGALYSLIYSPNWDEIFGPSLSGFSNTEKPMVKNDHLNKIPRLRYFNIYEMVGLDLTSNRLYWISNTSVTKIEYAQLNVVELNILDRGVIDLPIMIHPTSLAMGLDWIFIANFTGIWRFDRLNGRGAVQVAGYPGRDERQMVSHAKIGIYDARDSYTQFRRLDKQRDMEIQIGV